MIYDDIWQMILKDWEKKDMVGNDQAMWHMIIESGQKNTRLAFHGNFRQSSQPKFSCTVGLDDALFIQSVWCFFSMLQLRVKPLNLDRFIRVFLKTSQNIQSCYNTSIHT